MKTLTKLTFLAILGMSLSIIFQSCSTTEPTPPGSTVTVDADAGPDETVKVGVEVNLDGSFSSSSDGSALTYAWSITTQPAGSVTTLSGGNTDAPTITPDLAGDYLISLTVSSGAATDIDQVTVTATPDGLVTPVLIGGTIEIDSVLTKLAVSGPDYRVTSKLNLYAKLTIMPGVIVEFEQNTGIEVFAGGAIYAVGTDAERITLEGIEALKGYWLGISIETASANNRIEYCDIAHAGSEGFDGANLKAGIMVQETGTLKLHNSSIKMSNGHGLYMRHFGVSVDFANNVISGNDYPAYALVHQFDVFDADSDYTGNAVDYIDNGVDSNYTADDDTWAALNVPYFLIGTPHRIASAITISAGVTMLSSQDGGLDVYPDGSLTAVGTAVNKITLKGIEDIPGYWTGINIQSNKAANKLIHVNIMNGGSQGFDGANLKSNIMIEDAGRLVIQNTVSSKSGGYGLYIRSLSSTIPDFAGNTFTANAAPVMTLIKNFSSFDKASDYTGNTKDHIDTFRSNNNDITGTHSWLNLNVPYRLNSVVEDIAGSISIEAGTTFMAAQNGGLEVVTGGSLSAVGTSSLKIRFLGEEDVTGYWTGLRFNAASANNKLDFVIIANGGSEGFDGANRKANVEIGPNGTGTITNTMFFKSGDAGIRVQAGGVLTQSNNTFGGNLGVDIDVL